MFWNLVVAVGLAVLSGFAGAFEAALISLSRSRLEDLLEDTKDASGLSKKIFVRSIVAGEESVRLSATLLHAFTLGGFLFYSWVSLVRPSIDHSMRTSGHLLSWETCGIIAILLLLAGKLRAVAVFLGGMNEERLVLNGARCAWLMTLPLWPVTWLFIRFSRVLARGLGHSVAKSAEEKKELREEEVIAAVSDGELDGVVEEEQREMIESIFDLKDSDVADIFTPRTEMVSASVEMGIADAIALALDKGFSRLPVHEETRDNIVGIFYVRDALEYWGHPAEEIPVLKQILRKPLFVPETKKVSELLREMRESQTHMAIVLDEYGGTAGLVTIEDVLEEIVGDIHDEYDEVDTESEDIVAVGENTIEAEASVHVSDINEAMEMDLIPEDDDFETLGGFVLDVLGHIPQSDECFEYKALTIRVIAADERRVERVRIDYDPDWEED